MKQKANNSYPLRFYNYNNKNMPLKNIPNYSDYSRNSNQKIITVEKNLNDLKLDTETELSKGGSDLSLVLDGLKKEIDEISHNIIETHKKVVGYSQKNLQNSKRLREKSLNNYKLPFKKEYNQSEINVLSLQNNFKNKTPSKINKINNIYHSNNYYINSDYTNHINNNLLPKKTYYSSFNYNIKNNTVSDNHYNNQIHFNNTQNYFYKQANTSINKNEKSLNTKVTEITNELNPLKNVTNKLIKDINYLKEENEKLIIENNEFKTENKIINNNLIKIKTNYENELKSKEILIN